MNQANQLMSQSFTLYTGWTAGSCLYMAMANTSVIRCVLSRCVMVWWCWKSAERTQIFASSQSYWPSVGRKIGLSSPGICPSWRSRKTRGNGFTHQVEKEMFASWCNTTSLHLYGYRQDLVLSVLVEQTDRSCQVLQCARVCAVSTDAVDHLVVCYVDVTCLEPGH